MSPKSTFVFCNSPSLSISPSTKAWVSELITMPSPQNASKKSTIIMNNPKEIKSKNNLLQTKINDLKKQLK
jgi:hypothetical protein